MASAYKENVNPELDEAIFNKAWKIVGEIAMFILFELWKLWLAFDGVCTCIFRNRETFSVYTFNYRSSN